jgi:hypothetical protein
LSVSDAENGDQVYQEIPGGLMDVLHEAAQNLPDEENGDDK